MGVCEGTSKGCSTAEQQKRQCQRNALLTPCALWATATSSSTTEGTGSPHCCAFRASTGLFSTRLRAVSASPVLAASNSLYPSGAVPQHSKRHSRSAICCYGQSDACKTGLYSMWRALLCWALPLGNDPLLWCSYCCVMSPDAHSHICERVNCHEDMTSKPIWQEDDGP